MSFFVRRFSDVTAFAQPSSDQSSSHNSLNEYPRTVAVVVTYNREDSAAEDLLLVSLLGGA